MNKKRITKYTRSMVERQKEQQLQKEVERLQKELAAQKRRSEHEISVLKGKLEKATRRIGGLQKHINLRNKVETVRIKAVSEARLRQATEKAKKSSKPKPGRKYTKTEKDAYYTRRNQQEFIPHFMTRLRQEYGDAFTEEDYLEMEMALRSMSNEELYSIVKDSDYNMDKVMFESDSAPVAFDEDLTPAQIYHDITGNTLGR